MQRISHWVNNKVVAGTSGNVGKVYNPATGEVQAEVDLASVAEVDAVLPMLRKLLLRGVHQTCRAVQKLCSACVSSLTQTAKSLRTLFR